MEESASSISRALPLGLMEGRLLEVLALKLQAYISQPDIQMILDDLRSELFVDLDLGKVKTLHSITLNCRKCPELKPQPQTPAWNKVDPDCLFIMDLPPSPEVIDLFVKALSNAGFSSKRVCLTYLNRCSPKSFRTTTPEEINNCSPYLITEIQLLQPKLIVPLGVVTASSVLGTSIKMANDHGNILWLGPWAIMPTYSPSYVLKATESKVAITSFNRDIEYAYRYCYGDPPK